MRINIPSIIIFLCVVRGKGLAGVHLCVRHVIEFVEGVCTELSIYMHTYL